VTPLQRTQLEAEAAEAGIRLSELINRRLFGPTIAAGSRSRRPVVAPRPEPPAEPVGDGGELERLIAQFARTMPLRNAESLAKRELQRRRG